MSLADLASFGSLVGGLAVLVSLIYLSLQVRQNTRHMRAQIQQGRAMRAWEFNMRLADGSAHIGRIWLNGQRASLDMTGEEEMGFLGLCRATLVAYEDSFRQHRAGLMDDSTYRGTELIFANRLATPGIRAGWKVWRETFDQEFRDRVDSLLRATPVNMPPPSPLKAAFQRELAALQPPLAGAAPTQVVSDSP
jgi:hypothetical protein